MKRYIVIILSFWWCCMLVNAQYTGEFLTYNNTNTPSITGNPTMFTADKQVRLLPGFRYAATAGKSARFRTYSATVPNNVNLIFRNTDPGRTAQSQFNPPGVTPPLIVEHKGVRVGEYYWMDNNFNHRIPYRNVTKGDYPKDSEINPYGSIKEVGYADLYNSPQEMNLSKLNKYMGTIKIDANKFQPNIADFEKYYGKHYLKIDASYMDVYGEMYENSILNTTWKLPSHNDFKQLFAMSEVKNWNIGLDFNDVYASLNPRENEDGNPLYRDLLQAPGSPYHTQWFQGSNKYGLKLMGSGAKANGVTSICNNINSELTRQKDCNEDGSVYGWPKVEGDIYALFYTTYFFSKNDDGRIGHMIMHDYFDYSANNEEFYHWMSIRWRRRLTDKELGYRLVANSKQDEEVTDIKIIRWFDPDPTGYSELKPGYLRGFYVQYILDNPTSGKTVGNIVELAKLTECVHRYQKESGTMCFNVPTRDAVAFNSNVEDYGDAPSLEQAQINPLFIYPNPTIDILNIDSESPIASVKVYNAMGGLVKTFKDVSKSVDLSSLSAGVYTLIIQTNDETASFKVMKK